MDVDTILSIAALSVLLLLSAFFGAAEIAFSALNHIRVKNSAEGGSKRAKLALKLYENFDKTLSTILTGNTLVNISIASISTVLFVRYFGETGVIAIATAAILIFGEVTPKSLAKERPEKFAYFMTPLLYFLCIILTPLNFLFVRWRRFLGKVFKIKIEEKSITEEELLSIVEEAEHEGTIDEQEMQMIQNVIENNDLEVQDILTPRLDIVAAPKNISREELTNIFLTSGYTRIPIYDESIDNIIGTIHLRDFFNFITKNGLNTEYIIQKPYHVVPTMEINELLRDLQKKKIHMAIVSDEYGGTAGLVTLEDILEEIVGEIWDESDEVVEEFEKINDTTYKVSCAATIDDMFELFAIEDEVEATSVSGWIMDELGKIPEEGDTFTYKHLKITVLRVENRRTLECEVEIEQSE